MQKKPLFWASQADYAGRKPLYIISLLIYIAANILLAALPANLAALFILRVVQGFGAASVLSLGAGTVADIIEPKKRASAMSLVLLGPQLGPVLGPLLGGALTGGGSWRWIFWFLGLWTRAPLDKVTHVQELDAMIQSSPVRPQFSFSYLVYPRLYDPLSAMGQSMRILVF